MSVCDVGAPAPMAGLYADAELVQDSSSLRGCLTGAWSPALQTRHVPAACRGCSGFSWGTGVYSTSEALATNTRARRLWGFFSMGVSYNWLQVT